MEYQGPKYKILYRDTKDLGSNMSSYFKRETDNCVPVYGVANS